MRVFLAVVAVAATVLADPEVKDSGLKVEYVSKPDSCDKVARNGDMLTMHYTGTLEDGKKFDSSYDRSEPFKFQIGVGQVIKGWEEGVLGMCIGEKRRLIVPPELGYGDQGAGDIIPGGATLFFDIELVGTEEGPTPVNVFKQIDIDSDNSLSRDEISGYLKQQVETMASAGGEQGEEAKKMMEDQDKLVEETVKRVVLGTATGKKEAVSYYVIFSCTERPNLVGIHKCSWKTLAKLIPGGKVIGGNARDCKKFSELEEAKEYFLSRAAAGTDCVLFERDGQ